MICDKMARVDNLRKFVILAIFFFLIGNRLFKPEK